MLLELAPDAIVVTDVDGRISLVNRQTEHLFGYVRQDLLGQPLEVLLLDQLDSAHRRQPLTAPAAARGRHRDGHDFPIEVSLAALSFDGMSLSMASIRDTSGSRRARPEQAADRTQELEAIIEAMTDAVGVYDADGHLVRANSALHRLFALDGDPHFTTLSADERADRIQARHPDGRALLPGEDGLARFLRGEALTSEAPLVVVITTLDGRDVWLSITGAPLRDEDGRVVGAVSAARDVTEQLHMQQRTHQALEALLTTARSLVDPTLAPELVAEPSVTHGSALAHWLAELTRRTLGCRRVSIHLVEPGTRLRRPMAVVGLAPELEAAWWADQEALQVRYGEDASAADQARLEASGTLVIDMRQPPYDQMPNPYGMSTVLVVPLRVHEDVVGVLSLDYEGEPSPFPSDQRELAEAVAQLAALILERERLLREREESRANELALLSANQRMDEFLGIASHELKTPITSVKANIQMAERRLQPFLSPEPLTEHLSESELVELLERLSLLLTRADTSVGYLVRLVDDLLDVSRIHADKLEIEMRPLDLVGPVHEVVEEQRQLHPRRTILAALPDGEVRVAADADRVGQVITNYLTNALKYSKAESPVQVSVDTADGMARVAVRDRGQGLAPEERGRVWERFYRAPGITVQSGSGTGLGLGLHISRTIIERHGGQVGVESEVGRGSTFWFRLPLAPACT
jgi:PAS domain S-box-containing protein